MQEFPENDQKKTPLWRNTTAILLVVVLIGAFLRLTHLGQSPPGLNQDEAANAWNAYCLLKTGKDQAGVSWPVFYTHAFGGNRSTLHIYTLIPLQAIGGMNVITTRLPAAIAGILTILVIYFVGKRLFSKEVGLIAAVLLTFNPWHLYQSRWGHDAAYNAIYGLVPLAMLLLANMPILKANGNYRPGPLLAALAGIVSAVVCYGYHSVRIFVPVFLFLCVLMTVPSWWQSLKTRRGFLAIAAFVIGFAIIFGPLAWQHIFHPEGIARHASYQPKLPGHEQVHTMLKSGASRYIRHFGIDFLFKNGDPNPVNHPPGIGQFHWYMLPLMILGFIHLLCRIKSSYAARVLLAFLMAYPIGDCLFHIPGMHALRSAPGLCSLVILAAFGAFNTWQWLGKWGYSKKLIFTGAIFIAFIGLNIHYLSYYYGEYNRNRNINIYFNTDLLEACKWLRPHLDEAEAVFCTTTYTNMPYAITLLGFEYDPQKWFQEPCSYIKTPHEEWEYCTQYGKIRFMYDESCIVALKEMLQKTHRGPIFFIIRPGELNSRDPIHKIYGPDGEVTLWICEM